MPFNPNAVDNMWDYEDFVRRVTQKLFDTELHPARARRNRHYRAGLLQIMDGVMTETHDVVVDGVERIADQFPKMRAMVDGDLEYISSESE